MNQVMERIVFHDQWHVITPEAIGVGKIFPGAAKKIFQGEEANSGEI